jgi:hypothetical protein
LNDQARLSGCHLRLGVLASVSILLTLASCAAQTTVRPREPQPVPTVDGEFVSMTVGLRSFSSDEWAPVEDQALLAFNYQLMPEGAAVSLDIGLSYSEDDTSVLLGNMERANLEAGVWEASAGIYKEFGSWRSPVHPYCGVGASLLVINSRLRGGPDPVVAYEDEAELGYYARAGLLWTIYAGAQVGFDVRYVTAGDVRFGEMLVDGDNVQMGVIFRGAF